MAIDSRCVANTILKYFIDRKDPIKNMKLQKLLYFFCGYEYAIQDRWLIDANFEAWPYGPVCPPVYYAVSQYERTPIIKCIRGYGSMKNEFNNDSDLKAIFDAVMQKYGELHDWNLSNITHKEDSPWTQTIRKEFIGSDISRESIKKHFESLVS